MDIDGMNQLMQFINGVGFPIATAIYMFYLYNKTITELNATLQEMSLMLKTLNGKIAGVN